MNIEEDIANFPKSNTTAYFTHKRLKELDIHTNAIPQLIEYSQPKKRRITVSIISNRSAFLQESALKIGMA